MNFTLFIVVIKNYYNYFNDNINFFISKKVLKFGGTSVGSIDRINHVAKIIKVTTKAGNELIVIVSAMAGTTNKLMEYSKSVSKVLINGN